jgi:hypothetical protein
MSTREELEQVVYDAWAAEHMTIMTKEEVGAWCKEIADQINSDPILLDVFKAVAKAAAARAVKINDLRAWDAAKAAADVRYEVYANRYKYKENT